MPVLRKVFKKILNKLIVVKLNVYGVLHGRQYVFRVGRWTKDALVSVLKAVQISTQKYVLAVFLDIV